MKVGLYRHQVVWDGGLRAASSFTISADMKAGRGLSTLSVHSQHNKPYYLSNIYDYTFLHFLNKLLYSTTKYQIQLKCKVLSS